FTNLRRWNLRRLVEVKLLQRLHPRQARVMNALLHRVPVALFGFHRQQRLQIANVVALLLPRLLRQRDEVRADHRDAQRLAVLLYAGMFQNLSGWIHRATSATSSSSRSYSLITGNGRS